MPTFCLSIFSLYIPFKDIQTLLTHASGRFSNENKNQNTFTPAEDTTISKQSLSSLINSTPVVLIAQVSNDESENSKPVTPIKSDPKIDWEKKLDKVRKEVLKILRVQIWEPHYP